MTERDDVNEEFLDSQQYAEQSIHSYESVFGPDFVSPGGAPMASELLARLDLDRGSRVLDAGCGLGGSAFLMARDHGWRVDGIDLSQNMIKMAKRRCAEYGLESLVNLEHGDCLELDRPNRYDAVYSRDVFMHIHNKEKLFEVLRGILRPGGRLLFTDYCCGDKPWQQEFSDYVEQRFYCLHTLPEYRQILDNAGFADVSVQDWTGRFVEILESELDRILTSDIGEGERSKLESGWRAKITRARSGDQRWGLLEAVKPG